MLMIRAGSSGVAAASRRGVTSCVIVNTLWRLSVRTRVQALSGYSSYGAPQLLPELLTRTWSSVDCLLASTQYHFSLIPFTYLIPSFPILPLASYSLPPCRNPQLCNRPFPFQEHSTPCKQLHTLWHLEKIYKPLLHSQRILDLSYGQCPLRRR
jgi:hypothetical protein